MKEIHVFAPATVANVACGFDVFGFAVEAPGDEVVARVVDIPGVRIIKITGDNGRLPLDPQKNTAGVAVHAYLSSLQLAKGIELEIHKKMPLGSGMGSSAASAVAAVFAVNELFGRPYTRAQLLPFVMEAERTACGTAHADNVAPALFGGFVLIRSYDPLDVVPLPVSVELFCTLVHPHIELRTEDARKILRTQIALKDAVAQWGNTAGLVAGLLQADFGLISRSLQDVIVEPLRAALIPSFISVKEAALASGALGASISGSGPSVFALSQSRAVAEKVGTGMQAAFSSGGMETDLFISPINTEGPRLL